MTRIRIAPFAVRIVQRKGGKAAIVYRRQGDAQGRDRLTRLAALSPLAFRAATPLVRESIKAAAHAAGQPVPSGQLLTTGAFHPLDGDHGARLACFAVLASGLRQAERLLRSVGHLRRADANEAAWWLGLMTRQGKTRAIRALRILTEAVQ